jgi:NAD(P)-dependent dehydrogenase (short-subunit alcohol dehydrogenase family)
VDAAGVVGQLPDRLEGKGTLITGGTSGIGLETALQFIAEGARVTVTGTNPKTMAEARATLGASALALRADAGDVTAQAGLAKAVAEAFGGIDAVFVNAGVAELRPIEAQAVVFLASDESPFAVGSELIIDGGMRL